MKLKFVTIPDNRIITDYHTDVNSIKELKQELNKKLSLNVKHLIHDGSILPDIEVLDYYNEEDIFILVKGDKSKISCASNPRTQQTQGVLSNTQLLMNTILNSGLNLDISNLSPGESVSTEFQIPINGLEDINTALESLMDLQLGNTENSILNSSIEEVDDDISNDDPDDLDDDNDEDLEETPTPPPLPLLEPLPITVPQMSQILYPYQTQLNTLLSMGFIDELAIRQALEITGGVIEDSLIYLS